MGTTIRINRHTFLPRTGDPDPAPINLRGGIDLSDIFSDHNAFYLEVGDPVVSWINPPPGMPTSYTFEEWQALGKDLNSMVFDPTDPVVAANINHYRIRDPGLKPPLIISPCCARFLFCVSSVPGLPCTDPDEAIFMQHLASEIGLVGWSDTLTYGSQETRTLCGTCDRNGLLVMP